jgi:hypothetical protein
MVQPALCLIRPGFTAGARRSHRVHPKEVTAMANERELIQPKGDKRFIRRDEQGRIAESDDAGRSLAQDRRKPAKHAAPRGQGDRGDRKPH